MRYIRWILTTCGLVLFFTVAKFSEVIAAQALDLSVYLPSVYLPIVIKEEQPTLTPTPTPTQIPTNTPTPTSTPIPLGVEILPNHSFFVDSINYLHIVGEVQNNTADDITFVKISVNIFNNSGQLFLSNEKPTTLITKNHPPG